jgi:murein DD-endopeptidase MepM/ murein hydrolase activator NlpD
MLAMFRRRHASTAFAMLGLFSITTATMVAASAPAGASVDSDKSDISTLERQIAEQGEHAQELVARFNAVQARVDAIDVQIAKDRKRLAADQKVEAEATSTLRSVAIRAYVTGSGSDSPILAMFGTHAGSVSSVLEQTQYLGAVGTKLDNALNALHQDQARTQDDQGALESQEKEAKNTLAQLTSARRAADDAISAEEARLTSVKGNLRKLLDEANKKHEAEEAAAERALAAAAQPPVSAPPSAPPTTTPPTLGSPTFASRPPSSSPSPAPVSSAGYANPLRAVTALTPERIDQGVDYAGFGPVYAMGNGVVLNTVGSGWPGGTFIAYQLSEGPARGLVVFVAEDVQPNVQIGDSVNANTVLGHMYAGPDGIETGWADGSRLPDTMAHSAGQYGGSNSTAFGDNFSRFLQSVGAPGGILSTPPRGTLPASWPRW